MKFKIAVVFAFCLFLAVLAEEQDEEAQSEALIGLGGQILVAKVSSKNKEIVKLNHSNCKIFQVVTEAERNPDSFLSWFMMITTMISG
jgi:hypothetical protein